MKLKLGSIFTEKKSEESIRRQKEFLIFSKIAHFSILDTKYFDISDMYFDMSFSKGTTHKIDLHLREKKRGKKIFFFCNKGTDGDNWKTKQHR